MTNNDNQVFEDLTRGIRSGIACQVPQAQGDISEPLTGAANAISHFLKDCDVSEIVQALEAIKLETLNGNSEKLYDILLGQIMLLNTLNQSLTVRFEEYIKAGGLVTNPTVATLLGEFALKSGKLTREGIETYHQMLKERNYKKGNLRLLKGVQDARKA